MKKGQVEIIGLVVIVILLIVLIVLFIKFNLSDDDSSLKDVRENAQVSSFLSAFIRSSSGNLEIKDLIVKCGSKDCGDLEKEIKIVMTSLYNDRKYSFEFKKGSEIIYTSKNCDITIPATNKFKEKGEVYEVLFWFC